MAINWITEPSDFSGLVGSTMPVSAELTGGVFSGCPIGETWDGKGVGYTPFTVSDWDYSGGVATILPNGSASFDAGVGGNEIRTGSVENFEKYVANLVFVFGVDAFPAESTLMQLHSLEAIFKPKVQTSSSGVTISSFGWHNEITPTHMEWLNTDLEICVEILKVGLDVCRRWSVSGGGVIYTSQEIHYSDTKMSGDFILSIYRTTTTEGVNKSLCSSIYTVAKTGLPSQCTGEAITYNLTLKDNTGTTKDTQVSTDGLYAYDALNVQTADTGTWTLEAENAGDIISSTFGVSIYRPGGYAPIQNVYSPVEGFSFMGSPINGTNRLVTQFTINHEGTIAIQNMYADGVADEIQDTYS